jgi:FAD binding domain/Berberine and berberine like
VVVGTAATVNALAESLPGRVIGPGSAEYDAARRPPIARFEGVEPRAIVRCRDEEDVVRALSFARERGLELAVRSGGHCFAGRSSTRGLLIDLAGLDGVSLENGIAAVGAGARLAHVYDTLDQHGLTIAGGCGPTVGIAGLALGGGLGILGRMHGLTCDQLVGARVALADGHVLDCDEDRNEDLFWALRGSGGGQFGIVTRLRLRALSVPDATCLHLTWPVECGNAVLAAWQELAPQSPDELAASMLMIAPRDPVKPVGVHVFGASIGPKRAAEERLAPLLEAVATVPASVELEQLPYRDAKRYLADNGPAEGASEAHHEPPPGEAHGFSKSEFFEHDLPAETIEALVQHLTHDRMPGQARVLDLSPWGGAYNRVPIDATAFAHRSARFLLKQEVLVDAPHSAQRIRAAEDWLSRSWSLAHPFGTGGVYPNFPDPDLDDALVAYHGANLNRLMQVKARYDPGNLFHFHQSVQPITSE